jgi:hypothetical protein
LANAVNDRLGSSVFQAIVHLFNKHGLRRIFWQTRTSPGDPLSATGSVHQLSSLLANANRTLLSPLSR